MLYDICVHHEANNKFSLYQKVSSQNISSRSLKIVKNSVFRDEFYLPCVDMLQLDLPVLEDLSYQFTDDIFKETAKSQIYLHTYKSSTVALKHYIETNANKANHEYRIMSGE